MSHVEEDGAGREAKVGDVCSELEPLQTRAENKTQCDFFFVHLPPRLQTKGTIKKKRLFSSRHTKRRSTPTTTISLQRKCQGENTT